MHILTFDIEDWFHLLDHPSTKTEKDWLNYEARIHQNVGRILRYLDEKGLKATFFCLGWIAEKYPEVIREIDAQGHEIGSHTYMHQLIYEQKREVFANDLKASIALLEDLIGKKVTAFRAPGFSLTDNVLWVFEELIYNGITHDSSIFPAPRAHGGFSRIIFERPQFIEYNGVLIKEFPINTKLIINKRIVYSGGGYFRFFPKILLESWFKKDGYIMTYFHPRDFDPDQPRLKDLSMLRRFKSYYGLSGCFKKFVDLTNSFNFVDIRTADGLIDWEDAPITPVKL